jgi:hypothetical protein
MSEQPMTASVSADAAEVARLRQEHRCQTLIHTTVRRGRCGAKGSREWHDGTWYCKRHGPDGVARQRREEKR